jgi:hypothetical protein
MQMTRPSLYLADNSEKREIAKGEEAMWKEVDSKLSPMKETNRRNANSTLEFETHS